MIKILLDTISKTVVPTNSDIELCTNYFESIQISKNTILEEEGKIPEYLYFIVTGYMRLFYYDENGDEQTTFISQPNSFLASFLCFINQINATENIECVTDCQILRIKHAHLKTLIDQSENFKKFSLIIFQEAITATSIRANDLATLTAEQRYKKLIEKQSEIVNNLPVQYIASYLGIKPQSLSRIRKQIL